MNQLNHLLLLLLIVGAFSCKKDIENKQRDLLIDAITNGVWVIEEYKEGTVNITATFDGYEFKFTDTGSVSATRDTATTSGTWVGDITNYSIASNFPGADDPIKKLNGIWKITDSYWDYVKAEMTTSNGKNILHLRKKP